jgi:hypothetical protein
MSLRSFTPRFGAADIPQRGERQTSRTPTPSVFGFRKVTGPGNYRESFSRPPTASDLKIAMTEGWIMGAE